MTDIITIRGTATPSSYLPRGHVRAVARTPLIEKMIRAGYVEVVPAQPEKVLTPAQAEEFLSEAAQVLEADPDSEIPGTLEHATPSASNTVPRRNESKGRWQKFLKDNGVPFDPKWSRDQLIEAWGLDDEEE